MTESIKKPDDKSRDELDQQREDYNKVVASAELGVIQLVNLTFDVTPSYFTNITNSELGYVITVESSEYDKDAGAAACIINFQVNATHSDETLLQCNARYTVMYEIGDDCEEDAVKGFIERVGVFACYPYFRSVFANLDWAANTRLPPLPVHKEDRSNQSEPLQKKRKKKRKVKIALDEV